jgi:alkanesulfonate monooxygenase SsuD/methylene tetrahydromethanopterin reductase-like flavin-dependent oxidoreductase (luciferase family)
MRRIVPLAFVLLAASARLRVHKRARRFALSPQSRLLPDSLFFVNLRTRRLGNFFTTSQRYRERHGIRVGTPTPVAEHLLHHRVDSGCSDVIFLGRPHSDLTVEFGGGKMHRVRGSSALTITGGHVSAFALHGKRSETGVFDCL